MNALRNAVRGIGTIWSHGDEDDFADDPEPRRDETPSESATSAAQPAYTPSRYNAEKPYGFGSNSSTSTTRRPRAVPMALRRDKNIYTLKPKNLEETAIAADHLKTGSAVVLNLDDVDRLLATRIIDFMSGVCYGLENQGHAMKLGDTIFLFTPGEFEISSDETDYGENREFFFKDVPATSEEHASEVVPAQPRPEAARAAVSSASPRDTSLRDATLRDSRAWET